MAPQYDFPDKATTMSDVIETLLLRNLQEVFGERDPARRRAAIAELYTEDCTVLLPLGRYVGHTALDQVANKVGAYQKLTADYTDPCNPRLIPV